MKNAIAAALLSAATVSSYAVPVTYVFTGAITSDMPTDSGRIASGASFSGSFVYDADGVLISAGDGENFFAALLGMDATVDGYSIHGAKNNGEVVVSSDASDIVLTSRGGDNSGSPITVGGTTYQAFGLELFLYGDSNAIPSDNSLPDTLSFGSFTSTSFEFQYDSDGSFLEYGYLTSLTPLTPASAVPEPTSGVLMAIGLLVLTASKRLERLARRKASSAR